LDITARDAVAGFDTDFGGDGRTLAYTPDASRSLGPNGTGSMVNFSGQYYLCIQSNHVLTPEEFREQSVTSFFPLRLNPDPGQIAADVGQQPKVTRVIVWDRIEVDEPVPATDDVRDCLGGQWQRQSQQLFPVRVFWDWGTLYTFRRRVYVRGGG
jgi:hypothetical protein